MKGKQVMKREELKALGLSDEHIETVMKMHGEVIQNHQSSVETSKTETETLKNQLTEANKQIENFKGLKIDEIQAAANDYKTKYEQAQTDAATQLANLKFDHALESALTGAKAKNAKAVQALLNKDALKLNEDGSILGLNEQLETIKKESDYLFDDGKVIPKIVTNTNNQSVLGDKVVDAARKAAGLTTEQK